MKLANQVGEVSSTRDSQVKEKCEYAASLEMIGDYEAARSALNDLWGVIGERPLLDGLAFGTRAELLLRVGTLTGYLGSARQIAGAQEMAKDLLSESVRAFSELGADDRAAEAQAGLAICYWREGAMDEARVSLSTARAQAKGPTIRLRILVNSTLPEVSTDRLIEALVFLDQGALLLDEVPDHAVKGSYHMQRGLVLKRLGGAENFDRALIENTAAAFHFKEANHKRYLARIENNIGSLLLELGRFAEALEHLDKSRTVFVNLKDSGSVAQVNETRARLFLAQGRYSESDRAAFSAASVLEQGGESSLLAEALTTQGISRARLGRHQSARDLLLRAARIVDAAGDLETAGGIYLTAIEELHPFLPAAEVVDFYNEADGRLSRASEHSRRIRSCARITVNIFREHIQARHDLPVGGSFREDVKRYEAELIRGALDQSGGSVTRAARLLGVSHQALSDLIKHKHTSLQSVRTPRRPRRRSIIKKR
ncbi:MAG TPA: tetratricopeptide repeat protein [Pyrinomonadaceae bacterium]|nr:tetratricopeptide repeat protein [Pyrinomonadaceae bacterium]